MLEPTNRFMLVDALRPPSGHRLDVAVGTTFTLDLDALLLATVSFAVFDRLDTEDGRPDPIALLESVRRHADNITVFAQAGALSGPRSHPPIFAYLEDAVVPVRPPRPGHLFHPKVWALRFVDADGAPCYRLVIMSRNLTFDASWDTIVALDGVPTDDPPKHTAVVGDFIESLPSLALHRLDPRRSAGIRQLAADIRNVRWELPPGVRGMRFHPLGRSFKSPTITGSRILVMSPFLTQDMVQSLGRPVGPNVLVSRAAALDKVGANAVAGFAETFVVDTGDDFLTTSIDDSNEEPDAGDPASELDMEPPRSGVELSGLHAKVYVTEGDDYTRLWLGSANATGAAFDGNAEFVVELRLDREQWTVDRFLDDGGKASLRSMLVSYAPVGTEPAEPTAVEVATRRLDAVLRDLATARYTVDVTPDGPEGDSYRLDLGWKQPAEGILNRIREHGIEVSIGPATQVGARVPYADVGATIASATLQAVTSFLMIEARTRIDGHEVVGRTLVNARLSGAPSDRKEQLLASVLDDSDKVLRYLLFLLAELTDDQTLLDSLGGAAGGFDWSGASTSPPLLETLLRALAHTPESLDRVGEFISDLQAGTSGGLFPPGFAEVWRPISAAREQLR